MTNVQIPYKSKVFYILLLIFLFLIIIIFTFAFNLFAKISDMLAKTSNSSEEPFTDSPEDIIKTLKGKIVFQSNRDGDFEIFIMDVDGKNLKQLTHNNAEDQYPRWSPDGKRIVFQSNRDGNFQIYIMNEKGRDIRRITHNSFNCYNPEWFPDGRRIAFDTLDNGDKIFVVDLHTGNEMMLTDFWFRTILPAISPDGKSMAFTANKLFGWGIYHMDLSTKEIKLLDGEGGACRPDYSPDGEKIAYVSGKGKGKENIWVMNLNGSNKMQITKSKTTFDYDPSWSPDGKWIAYASSHDKHKGNWEIFIIRADGKHPLRLTNHPSHDKFPDWY
ncbi:MAG: DPP IV N-terminal domain-containing protein [Acidobacteriota bacterium]